MSRKPSTINHQPSMERRRVLKADDVILHEPLMLNPDPAASPDTAPPCDGAGSSVRLAQKHPEYVVLEVACPCGRTTYIRCDYDSGERL